MGGLRRASLAEPRPWAGALGWLVSFASLALLASGCESAPKPWDQPTGGAPPPTSAPAKAPPPSAEPTVASAGRIESGGPFVSCYAGFRPSAEPVRDVTRLSLVCGPSTGMRRVLDVAYEGALSEGGTSLEVPLKLQQGSCYRIFAVGDPQIEDLDVSVVSARGVVVAGDPGVDRVVILQPDRPLCSTADDEARIRVAAKKGRGRFALEIYAMP